MKTLPQHACESCCAFIQAVRDLKHEVSEKKRLPFEEMQAYLTELQVRLGALESHAAEIKAFTTAAVVASGVREEDEPTTREAEEAFCLRA